MKKLSVLILEDHPLTINSYERALRQIGSNNNIAFDVHPVVDCDSAQLKIEDLKNEGINIDLAFIDIRVPASKNHKINSGEDIGLLLKEHFNGAKLIVITSLNNNFALTHVFKTLNPDVFLIKTELTPQILEEAIIKIINGSYYYGETVINLLRNNTVNDFNIDKIDRQILHYLSQGIKTKNLCNYVPLSKPGIVKRKQQLRIKFGITQTDDLNLIVFAKKQGLI